MYRACNSTSAPCTAVTNGSTSYPQWGLSWTGVYPERSRRNRYGNRTAQSRTHGSTAPTTSPTIDTSTNRISAMNSTNFTYDSNGNLTQDDLYKYKYDAENRLVELHYPNDTLIASCAGVYPERVRGLRTSRGDGNSLFREHSARVGRFHMADPDQGGTNPQGLNRYAYVTNDPINKSDPLGLRERREGAEDRGLGGNGERFAGVFGFNINTNFRSPDDRSLPPTNMGGYGVPLGGIGLPGGGIGGLAVGFGNAGGGEEDYRTCMNSPSQGECNTCCENFASRFRIRCTSECSAEAWELFSALWCALITCPSEASAKKWMCNNCCKAVFKPFTVSIVIRQACGINF